MTFHFLTMRELAEPCDLLVCMSYSDTAVFTSFWKLNLPFTIAYRHANPHLTNSPSCTVLATKRSASAANKLTMCRQHWQMGR